MTAITRRALLLAGATAALAALCSPLSAQVNAAATPTSPRSPAGGPASTALAFDIVWRNHVIGEHRVDFLRQDGQLIVNSRTDAHVELLGATIYDLHHRSHEVYRDGCLIAYRSDTLLNGETFAVSGKAVEGGFELTTRKGTTLLPANMLVASYWNPDTLRRSELIDPKRGKVKTLEVLKAKVQSETALFAPSAAAPVTRYDLTGFIDGAVFYDSRGRWVGATIERPTGDIQLRLRS